MPTQQEFAAAIRNKYNAYQDIDDSTLVARIVEKYPIYKSQISDFGQPITAEQEQPLKTTETQQFVLPDVLSQNMDKNFVQRIVNADQFPTRQNEDQTTSSHLMASAEIDGKQIAFPTLVQDKKTGELFEPDDPVKYAIENDEFIEFDSEESAREFAEGGYKQFFNKGSDQATDPIRDILSPETAEMYDEIKRGQISSSLLQTTQDTDIAESIKPINNLGIWGDLKLLYKTVATGIIGGAENLPGVIASSIEGGDVDAQDITKISSIIKNSKLNQEMLELSDLESQEKILGMFTAGDIQQTLFQLPYSLTAMGASMGGIATTKLLLKGASKGAVGLASAAVALLASGTFAYRATKNQFVRDQRDLMYRLTPNATEEMWENWKQVISGSATKYALWEAIPEAAGNLLLAKIYLLPAKKLFPLVANIESTVARSLALVITKIGLTLAEEIPTETITQLGQGRIEALTGLREQVSESTWEEIIRSLKEILPQTIMTSTILGGVGSITGGAVNKLKSIDEARKAQQPDEVVETIKQEEKIEITKPIIEPVVEKPKEPEKAEVSPKVEKPIEKEVVKPVQPVEGRKAAEPKIEKPEKATTENIDEFLGQELKPGTLGKDDTGYFVEKAGEKDRIAPSQAVKYVNEAKLVPKKLITETDFDKSGDLTDKGFAKAQDMLKSTINDTAEQTGLPPDVLLKYYGFNKRGEYFRSEPILDVGKSIKHNELIDLIKKTAIKLNPEQAEKIINTVNKYSQEQLDALERGDVGFEVPKEVIRIIDVLEKINEKYRGAIEKRLPQPAPIKPKIAEKPKEVPIIPKVEEKPAEAKPPAVKPIVVPTIDTFKDLAKESKDAKSFFEATKEIKKVPKELADKFFKDYGGEGVSMEKAAEKFFNEVHKVEPEKAKRVATVEEIEKSRKKYNLSELPLDEARKWVDVFARAEQKKAEALPIAQSIHKKPRVLTGDEFATLVLQKTKVEDLIDESQAEIAKAIDIKNIKEQERHTSIMENALSDLDEITDAIRFSNREAGRALNIIQVALKKEGELYKVSKILQMAKIAKGVKLTNREIDELGELGRKIGILRKRESQLTKDIEALQEKLSKQDAVKTFVKTAKTAPRERSQAALKAEREGLFNVLNKIGYRLNDVIGLTYESATIVSKLAINYFESGVTELDAIVERIRNKVPDLSKKNVYDSIGGRIKKTKKTVISNTKQEIADLKTQARLMGEIEDAYNGIFEQSKKRKAPSAKIFALQKKLNELKSSAFQTIRDEEKLNKILLRIDNVKDQLETGARDIRKTKRADSPDIRNAKQELSELRQLISAKDKIADLENQLKTGDFKVPVKIQRVVKSADLLSTQVKLTQLRREVRERIHALQPRTKGEWFIEIITLPRLLMSIADISMVRRQAGPIGARHPIQAIKFQPASLKALFSQNKADEIDVWIRKHENQPIREQAGLFLSSIESPLNKREEFFTSSLGDKIPIWGRVIKASNRHAVTYLNFMRVVAFDQFLETYPNATMEELMVWARLVNISSGRGDLGAFNKVADELSVVLFSPRFSTSRVQLPFEALRYKNWKHPSVRKEMSKHIMSYLSITGTVLFLASLAGVRVDVDPDNPDFLKMRIGDTTIDIFSGFLQPIRVIILAILTALETIGVAKIKGTRDLRSAIERFVRYKEAPSITIPFELVTGTTAIGEETTPLKTITKHITPLAMQDIIDTYKSEPFLLPIVVPLALVGEGINTYKRRKRIKKSIKKK